MERDRGAIFDIAVPLVLVGAVWAVRHTFLFGKLVSEDRILEWVQAGVLAVALGILVSAAAIARGRQRVVFGGCSAVVFVALGEELAWGTRYLKTSVEAIASRNEQGDVTIHNLYGGLGASFFAIVAVSLGLVAIMVWRRHWVPTAPPALVVWLLVPAAYALLRMGLREPSYWIAKLSEAVEAVFAVALARVAWAARAAVVDQRRERNGAAETNAAPAATTSSPLSIPAIPDTVPTTVGPSTIPT